METLLTLETVTLVNGLAIQHSSEWEDYLEMNAQINGMTKEEYTAYYLGTQWQMQCMESLQRLTEKKVTRKQLDKAINDVAKITNELKKVVKEWAAARDAGNSEKQEEKLQELKKLNAEKSAAQDVVDDHIQQLDKNATLQTEDEIKIEIDGDYDIEVEKDDDEDDDEETTTESMNEKKSEFKEGDKVKLTLKGLQQMNRHRTPGISNNYSRSLGKIRDKDIVGTVERVFPSGSMNVDFDGVLYDIKDYMVVKESIDEKYREIRHQSTDFSKPGNDGDIYFSKREGSAVGVKRGDKLQSIYVWQKEPKFGKIQKSDKRWKNMGPASEELLIKLRGREEGKIMFDFVSNLEESIEINEGVHPKIKKAMRAVEKGKTVYGENIRFPGRFKILKFTMQGAMALVDYERKGQEPYEIPSMNIALDKMKFESVVNEKIKVASLADAIDAEQDGDLNKKHLDKILKRKEDGTMHQMTGAEEKTYHTLLRKYKINESLSDDAYTLHRLASNVGTGTTEEFLSNHNLDIKLVANAIRQGVINKYELRDIILGDAPKSKIKNFMKEYVSEAIDIDMINTEYGFWGTMDQYDEYGSIEIAFEDAMNYLIGSYNFTQQAAYNFLNSKWGRKLADEYHDGEHYNMVDAIDAFGNKSTWKKYAKMFSESKENTMKNLQTLESFINEAAPKLKTSKEEAGLLKLRDEIRRVRKGGSASRYSKEFDAAKKKALKAIEDMITYAKIGV